MNVRSSLFAVPFLLLAPAFALAASVDLNPVRDNTLFEIPDGTLSNGAGQQLYVGLTHLSPGFALRRGLIQFDLSSIPGGSTITNVTLKLHCSVASPPPNPAQQLIKIHRVTTTWGESTSDAGLPGGSGATAEPGDATWLYRFFSTVPWATPGGTFHPTASVTGFVGGPGFYTFGPTAQLIQDVQTWINAPPANFGWMLFGDEAVQGARRFESREATDPALRPTLHVDFNPTVGVEPAASRVDFGVRSIDPNPVSRTARVSLTLATSEPARLEVIDLAGRRLGAREIGSLGPGEHVVSFPELAASPAGIYWVRLTQGARTARTKAAVMP